MLEREDFKHDIKKQQSISIHEFLYPLVQATTPCAQPTSSWWNRPAFNLLIVANCSGSMVRAAGWFCTMPLLEGPRASKDEQVVKANYIGIMKRPKRCSADHVHLG